MRWLGQDEERTGQYRNKRSAQERARAETVSTGRPHQAFFTHTYRDLEECMCWTVVLRMAWKNGKLVTL